MVDLIGKVDLIELRAGAAEADRPVDCTATAREPFSP